MITTMKQFITIALAAGLLLVILLQGSDKNRDESVTVTLKPTPAPLVQNLQSVQQAQESVRYFFDTEGHSVEEIYALLQRAEELQSSARQQHQPMKIAMVMHGPDLDVFASKNYSMYKDVVDLAARLDSSGIIDFKACEMAMKSRGLSDNDLPAFFELVPFGPDEITELEGQGYVRL